MSRSLRRTNYYFSAPAVCCPNESAGRLAHLCLGACRDCITQSYLRLKARAPQYLRRHKRTRTYVIALCHNWYPVCWQLTRPFRSPLCVRNIYTFRGSLKCSFFTWRCWLFISLKRRNMHNVLAQCVSVWVKDKRRYFIFHVFIIFAVFFLEIVTPNSYISYHISTNKHHFAM